MLALKINDVKGMMNQLLIGSTFDLFPVSETSVTTFNTFTIDGRINKEFFDTDIQDMLTQNGAVYSLWKEIKPFCFSIIRGKRTPLQFKIIFQFSPEQASLLSPADTDRKPSDISVFFLNLQYKNNLLLCTTGVFQKFFSLEKTAEQQWDSAVRLFLQSHNIDYDLV